MIAFMLVLASVLPTQNPPLRLLAANPHYFEFRGKPTVLITSAEHYGAVLNLDFDAIAYLDTLAADGLNLTRVFSGTYREAPGAFKILDNTLAPRSIERYITPWKREGDKFDLETFNSNYFERLKSFVKAAGERGIVVEYVLFCPFYEESMWDISPMNAKNNRNGVGKSVRTDVLTLKHDDLVSKQLAFVRKVVSELNAFDNLYFEICNEPYFGGVTLEWQAKVAQTIVETEKPLKHRHLIAQNIANGSARVNAPDSNVSIFNFHYASPPTAVKLNATLGKPIGFDETGFKGISDRVYRRQAWEFILAGGAVFNNLDYSFTTDHEDGSAQVKDPTPGGGGKAFRQQMRVLKQSIEKYDFAAMFAAPSIKLRDNRELALFQSKDRSTSLVYAATGPTLSFELSLPVGPYELTWIDPRNGQVLKHRNFDVSTSQPTRIESPEFSEDIAASIVRRDPVIDCLGTWKGTLTNFPASANAKPVDVIMEIGRFPTHDNQRSIWRTTYSEAGIVKAVKNYHLCRGQGSEDLFVDEGNAIKLKARFLGGELIAAFKYDKILLISTLRITGETLIDEIVTIEDKAAIEGVQPLVASAVQRLELKRVDRAEPR
jgi:hypothetical protein